MNGLSQLSMYENVRSRVRINGSFSEEFEVKVGVHQGSVLSPLLFIMVLEALSLEFRTGCPWELLYADDLVLIADSMVKLIEKFNAWKEGIESKGLKVNIGKTKVVVSGNGIAPQGNGHAQYVEKALVITLYFVIFVHIGCTKVVVE